MRKHLILLIIAIFAIPISAILPIFGRRIWFPQFLAFLICLGFFGSLAIWRFNKYISLFTLLCLMSTIFVCRMGTRALLGLAVLYGAVFMVYETSKFTKKYRQYISLAIASLTLLMGGYLIVQYFNLDPFFTSTLRPGRNEMVGLVGAPGQIGSFFAITFPFAWRHFRIKGFPIILPFSIWGLIVSKASFAATGVIAGLCFYLFFKNRKLFARLIVPILILGLFYVTKIDTVNFSNITRFEVWKYAIPATIEGRLEVKIAGKDEVAVARPWMGYGWTNFRQFFPLVPQGTADLCFNAYDEIFTHAHNDFIEGFFELGIGFVIIAVLFYFDLLRRFLKAVRTEELLIYSSAFVIYSVNAQGNFLTYLAVSGMLLIIILGFIYGELRDGQRQIR